MTKVHKLTSQWLPLTKQEVAKVSAALRTTALMIATRAREAREHDSFEMNLVARNCGRQAEDYRALADMIQNARGMLLDVWAKDRPKVRARLRVVEDDSWMDDPELADSLPVRLEDLEGEVA